MRLFHVDQQIIGLVQFLRSFSLSLINRFVHLFELRINFIFQIEKRIIYFLDPLLQLLEFLINFIRDSFVQSLEVVVYKLAHDLVGLYPPLGFSNHDLIYIPKRFLDIGQFCIVRVYIFPLTTLHLNFVHQFCL